MEGDVPAGAPGDDEVLLVERLRAGDEAAFRALVVALHPALRRVARNYVPSDAVADDVVQETWLGVLNGIDRFEGRASVKTWVFRILVNRAKSRGERERRTVPFASAFDPSLDVEVPLVDPGRFGLVYNNLLIPILGTIFLPVTTLTYTFIFKAGLGGPVGLDWLWLAIALMADLSLYGGGAYSRRK